jgi:hypothetical protein
MRNIFLVLFICFLPLSALASRPVFVSEPNCDISVPPVSSGETSSHAFLIKVFPRKTTVSMDYSGCQTMWIQTQETWQMFSVQLFSKGQLQAWWMLDNKNPDGYVCKFSAGKLEADQPKGCYKPSNMGLAPSFPPGCIQEATRSHKMSEKCIASLEL